MRILTKKFYYMSKYKLLVTATLLMSSLVTKSQCKYDKNEIDKFTGIKKIETISEILHRDFESAISISFCKYDTKIFLKVGLNLSGEIYSIIEGDELILLCGKIPVALKALETNVIQGYVNMKYSITEEQLKILNNNMITDLRIYLRDSYIEKTIESKRSSKIMKLSTCI